MKTMTCLQLGGACAHRISAETFEEMSQKAQEHGMEMATAKDTAHLAAMDRMKGLMANQDAMEKWMSEKEAEFNALPQDE